MRGGARIYADDTAIFVSGSSAYEIEIKMNRNLEKLNQWAQESRLSINTDKTKYMIFNPFRKVQIGSLDLRIGDAALGRAFSYNYLGFMLDETLSFGKHIDTVLRACNQKVFWLTKIRKYISKEIAFRLYKSLIMSKLQYGCFFYTNASRKQQQQLQKLQNRALRVCCRAERYTSNLQIHWEAKVWPLELRGRLELLKLMHRISRRLEIDCGNTDNGEVGNSTVITRSQEAFPIKLLAPRTERIVKSVCYQGPRLWSELKVDKRKLPYDKFCVDIKSDLQKVVDNLTHI